MLLVKRRKTARTPLAAMEAAHLSQPVAGAASLIRRSRPSPDHPNPSAAPSRGARFVGAPQAAGIVLPPCRRRRRRFFGCSLDSPPPWTPTR